MLPEDTDAEPTTSMIYPSTHSAFSGTSGVLEEHILFSPSLTARSSAMVSPKLYGQTWLQTVKQGQAQAMKLHAWVCWQLSVFVVQA